MANTVQNVNTSVLRKCREQMALDIETVKKKLPSIEQIEQGERQPTFKQLQTLAHLYEVPDWVFISTQLPNKYRLSASPAFRQFDQQGNFDNYKIRRLVAKVENFRNLALEFREDIDSACHLPSYTLDSVQMAKDVRSWLHFTEDKSITFEAAKSCMEEKNVFIFMTGKFVGWSHIEPEKLRGFAIFKEELPIIVINDSDAKKAQSFTLFHELGHLLKKKNSLDVKERNDDDERWCNDLAGNVLMPKERFLTKSEDCDLNSLQNIEKLASDFQVSLYACIVRLRQLNKISQSEYLQLEKNLKKEYEAKKEKLKGKQGSPIRRRDAEVLRQFGGIYCRAVWEAYRNEEIGLHKLCKLLDLKQAKTVLNMEHKL